MSVRQASLLSQDLSSFLLRGRNVIIVLVNKTVLAEAAGDQLLPLGLRPGWARYTGEDSMSQRCFCSIWRSQGLGDLPFCPAGTHCHDKQPLWLARCEALGAPKVACDQPDSGCHHVPALFSACVHLKLGLPALAAHTASAMQATSSS